MSAYQSKLLRQCMILIDTSRHVYYFEPMSMHQLQSDYVNYAKWLMRCIEEDVMQRWEAEAHIWALQTTINNRIAKVKDNEKWKLPKAS